MSEVYCRTCEDDQNDDEIVHIPKDRLDSPAILTNITKKRSQRINRFSHKNIHSIYNVTSEPRMCITKDKTMSDDVELGNDVVVTSVHQIFDDKSSLSGSNSKQMDTNKMIRVIGKEELPVSSDEKIEIFNLNKNQNENVESFDKISNECQKNPKDSPKSGKLKMKISSKQLPNKVICINSHPLIQYDKVNNDCSKTGKDYSNRYQTTTDSDNNRIIYSTLPRIKKTKTIQDPLNTPNHPPFSIPTRVTADGTTIYYLSELSKNITKGFDK